LNLHKILRTVRGDRAAMSVVEGAAILLPADSSSLLTVFDL